LIEEGPKTLRDPHDYDAPLKPRLVRDPGPERLIACGVPQDWSTHMIGHELTALYGIDHGQSLAAVLPATLRHQRREKKAKLLQYAQRVWKNRWERAGRRDRQGDRQDRGVLPDALGVLEELCLLLPALVAERRGQDGGKRLPVSIP